MHSRKILALCMFCALSWADVQVQNVTVEVASVNELAITTSSPSLVINAAEPGDTNFTATSNGSTLAYTCNAATSAVISVHLDANLPSANLTLDVDVEAPTGGSASQATFTNSGATDDQTVLTLTFTNPSPPPHLDSGLTITYTFTATLQAGVVTAFNRTATYTLIGT